MVDAKKILTRILEEGTIVEIEPIEKKRYNITEPIYFIEIKDDSLLCARRELRTKYTRKYTGKFEIPIEEIDRIFFYSKKKKSVFSWDKDSYILGPLFK